MGNNLQIEYNKDCEFYRVTCPEGYYISSYSDDKDIRDFSCSPILYISGIFTSEEINEQYHLITEEEKREYVSKREATLEQKFKIINYGSN